MKAPVRRPGETVTDTVRRYLAWQLGVDEERVTPDAHIVDDLGADSIETVADLYRRERRRLRADALLIARKVDRQTRRQIWLNARRDGFTSLKRAARSHLEDHPHGYEIWQQIFPGVYDFEDLAARGKAAIRRARKAHHRQAQRARMARHQQACRAARVMEWGATFEAAGRTEGL